MKQTGNQPWNDAFACCPHCLKPLNRKTPVKTWYTLLGLLSTAQNTMSSIINSPPRRWVKSQHGKLSIWPLIYLVKELLQQECKNTDITTIFWNFISQISEIRKLRHREDKWFAQDHPAGKKRLQGLILGRLQSPSTGATTLYSLSVCLSMTCTHADLETIGKGVAVTGEDVSWG